MLGDGIAKPCWVVELCQAGLFVATSATSEIVGKGNVSSRVCLSLNFCLWYVTCFPSHYHNTLPPTMPLLYHINTQPYFHPTAVLAPIWDQFPHFVKLVDLGIGDLPPPPMDCLSSKQLAFDWKAFLFSAASDSLKIGNCVELQSQFQRCYCLVPEGWGGVVHKSLNRLFRSTSYKYVSAIKLFVTSEQMAKLLRNQTRNRNSLIMTYYSCPVWNTPGK